ncbi:MAG: hypothetical protein WA393_12545, partial [Nitrososphaeraceae archaeon]
EMPLSNVLGLGLDLAYPYPSPFGSHYFTCFEADETFSKRTAGEPKSQNIFTHVLSDQNPF